MAHDMLIKDVIAAAGGEIVGRIRLQKILYLLDQHGLGADAAFQYYHYGPYSRVLDDALDRAKALHGIKEEIRCRRDGAAYSVFKSDSKISSSQIGGLKSQDARRLIEIMKSATSTVIELAATIHWLVSSEQCHNWREELVRRKGVKTEGGRTEQALQLLTELGLAPQSVSLR
jgi:uncharacterized protein YwgA